MSLSEELWRIWRDDPAFSQPFEARMAADRRQISGSWERRHSEGDWEHDFNVEYSRPDPASTPKEDR